MDWPTVIARVPGSWGELVQGQVEGEDFLITCPVGIYTVALARPLEASGSATAAEWRLAGGRPRPRTAAALLSLARAPSGGSHADLRALPAYQPTQGPGGVVRLYSRLRPGAGMASSTADLCAAMSAATVAGGGAPLGPEDLFRRCLAVEPTDGIMFPGIALVDHRRGRRAEVLGPPPPLAIVGVDPGGIVDTLAFNRRADLARANRGKEPQVAEALALAVTAVRRGDPETLGRASTLSAAAHQNLLPNPLWEPVRELAQDVGAVGINVAHSGTVIGILLDPRRADVVAVCRHVVARLRLPARALELIRGGVDVEPMAAGTRWQHLASRLGQRTAAESVKTHRDRRGRLNPSRVE